MHNAFLGHFDPLEEFCLHLKFIPDSLECIQMNRGNLLRLTYLFNNKSKYMKFSNTLISKPVKQTSIFSILLKSWSLQIWRGTLLSLFYTTTLALGKTYRLLFLDYLLFHILLYFWGCFWGGWAIIYGPSESRFRLVMKPSHA